MLAIPFTPLSADVIELKDGTVYLGTAVVDDVAGITISSFGQERTISQSDILLVSKDLAAFSATEVEIRLPDRSVLKGKIRNYDEEIGLLLETYFGAITLPPKAIEAIQDPVQRELFFGVPFQAGLVAGYQWPLGDLAENFAAMAQRTRRVITGLVPICAECKRIRNDQGAWEPVEQYVGEHSEAKFTHGLCPHCLERLGFPTPPPPTAG